MKWEIKDYQVVNNGAVAGRFTLIVGPMEIRGFTHFRSEDGSEWVAGPQREYEKDGERKFYPFVYFPDKERWTKFQDWALVEIGRIAPKSQRKVYEEESDDLPF